MTPNPDLEAVVGPSFGVVLDHLDEAVIVLDGQRKICFANNRAIDLLGYRRGEAIGGRCRATTRGIDCETACPLTYALERQLEHVEDFVTVYRTRDGQPLPLNITVIPLRTEDGDLRGAVEILRPIDPDPGFFLAGISTVAAELRRRLRRLAGERCDVMLVGDRIGRIDVARAIHRYAGLSDDLFVLWGGSWGEVRPFPPGTAYADACHAAELLAAEAPAGWRLIVGVCEPPTAETTTGRTLEVVPLPSLADRVDDLPMVVAAWIRQMSPHLEVAPLALERLCRLARDTGLDGFQSTLAAAVASADGRLDEAHIPGDGYRLALVDEVLRSDRPLAALEERLLRETLERSCWKMQGAADKLGVSRVTLWRKMKEHGIERPNGG